MPLPLRRSICGTMMRSPGINVVCTTAGRLLLIADAELDHALLYIRKLDVCCRFLLRVRLRLFLLLLLLVVQRLAVGGWDKQGRQERDREQPCDVFHWPSPSPLPQELVA